MTTAWAKTRPRPEPPNIGLSRFRLYASAPLKRIVWLGRLVRGRRQSQLGRQVSCRRCLPIRASGHHHYTIRRRKFTAQTHAKDIPMPNHIQSELFIRLLSEALQADRANRAARLSAHAKASAGRFRQLFLSDIGTAASQLERVGQHHPYLPLHKQDARPRTY